MQKEIVLADMMTTVNKQSFFALHQIQSKIHALYPDVRVEFHILWDHPELNEQYWADLMKTHIGHLHSYDKQFFNDYVKDAYGLDYSEKFRVWGNIYLILIGHYLRRVLLKPYYIIYDDDILINDDFKLITDLALDNVAVLIAEPMNQNCDKVVFNTLVEMFGNTFYDRYKQRNPEFHGFNAGFQGIDLSIYDVFLSDDRMQIMLDMFNYTSIVDENGHEIYGNEQFLIKTQQQSFMSLMNVVYAKKPIHILDPTEYYVVPNWGHHPTLGDIDPSDENGGWNLGLASRITHFIGSPKTIEFTSRVDEYLKLNGFEL